MTYKNPGHDAADALDDDTVALAEGKDVDDEDAEDEPQVFAASQLNEPDVTRLYLNEISRASLLSAEEEVHYARRALQGDELARQRMITSNLRLVVMVARRYQHRGLDLDDLIEEGNLGLMHAVEKFDPERGFRFSTYATWWIRQSVERGVMNQGRTIRLPIHVIKEMNGYLRTAKRLSQRHAHEASAEEVAQEMECPVEDVRRMFELAERTASLDSHINRDSDQPLIEMIEDENSPDPAERLAEDELPRHLRDWLAEQDERQREVVMRRFGLGGHEPQTLEQVGQALGITRERARQVQIEALKALRQVMECRGVSRDALFG